MTRLSAPYSRGHKTDLLECDDDAGLSFTQEYIILYLRNIADSKIFWRTPKFSNLGVLLTPAENQALNLPLHALLCGAHAI